MAASRNCGFCKNDIPPSVSLCPHCGRPSLFRNVEVALSEQDYLQDRYDKATSNALFRGVTANVDDFERALENSRAVINRSLSELQRLSASDYELYATFYELAKIRLPKEDRWTSIRKAADAAFFTDYEEEIRFAALSLNPDGLGNYGDCSFILKDNMISHRASLFEENTAVFIERERIVGADKLPKGYKAVWADRVKLCVAKLAEKIDITTKSEEYSNLLVHQGPTSAEDEFVEVHIFGPMTIRTVEEVSFKEVPTTISKRERTAILAQIYGIKEKLRRYGVKVS